MLRRTRLAAPTLRRPGRRPDTDTGLPCVPLNKLIPAWLHAQLFLATARYPWGNEMWT